MPRSRVGRLLCLILMAVGLFGCDHATKIAAKATLEGSSAVPIAPGMLRGAVELRYVENDDIAFSALHGLGVPRSPSVLIAMSTVAIVAIVATAIAARRRRHSNAGDADVPSERATNVGIALILSGALGNLVDRIARGYVVDFIHVKGWPVFNIADIVVSVGVGLVALAHLLRQRRAAGDPPVG